MEYVASYLLLKENNQEPSKANITKLLASINATVDPESLNLFLSKIEGKNFEEIMAAGSALMVSQRAASATSAPAAAASTNASAKVAEPEEKEESSEDQEIDFF